MESAGNTRKVVGTGVREKTVPRTLLERLKESIFECLDETFSEVHGVYLDKGCSLFPTLKSVSAQEASRSVAPDSATLVAQVEHVRFYHSDISHCEPAESQVVLRLCRAAS